MVPEWRGIPEPVRHWYGFAHGTLWKSHGKLRWPCVVLRGLAGLAWRAVVTATNQSPRLSPTLW